VLRRRADRGASAVEFALVLPFLLLLVFGLIQYGLLFWAIQGGSDVARHAARLSAVGEPTSCTDFRTEVTGFIGAFDDGDAAVINRRYEAPDGTVKTTGIEVGDVAIITIQFDAINANLPFVPYPNDNPDAGNYTVTQTAEARVERIDGEPETCS
jgi:hypothetical protein